MYSRASLHARRYSHSKIQHQNKPKGNSKFQLNNSTTTQLEHSNTQNSTTRKLEILEHRTLTNSVTRKHSNTQTRNISKNPKSEHSEAQELDNYKQTQTNKLEKSNNSNTRKLQTWSRKRVLENSLEQRFPKLGSIRFSCSRIVWTRSRNIVSTIHWTLSLGTLSSARYTNATLRNTCPCNQTLERCCFFEPLVVHHSVTNFDALLMTLSYANSQRFLYYFSLICWLVDL